MVAFQSSKVYRLVSMLFSRLALILIYAYRIVGSLWLSGSCRFEPSCSVYAQEAIERHGVWIGGRLAIHRLMSCRPGGRFGFDPVPVQQSDGLVLKKECE